MDDIGPDDNDDWRMTTETGRPAAAKRLFSEEEVIKLIDQMAEITPQQLLERPVLTVSEAGIVLGLKTSAAYEAVRRGEIPTITVNNRLRVLTADLKKLLKLS